MIVKKQTLIIYGKHAVVSALSNKKRIIDKIFVLNNNSETKKIIIEKINQVGRKLKINNVDKVTFDKILQKKVKHQGVIVISKKLVLDDYKSLLKNKSFKYGVILDSITDPNNIGAIYRSANAFGIDFIINSNQRALIESSALLNTACGAFENVNSYTTNNISNAIKKLKEEGWWVVGLDHEATTEIKEIFLEADRKEKYVFVFGSEGKGIRRLIKKNCSLIAKIPHIIDTHSINVSNAAAIIFHEIFKLKKI